MIFKNELKIFQYHFPGFPIFPGALLLDYVKNCILNPGQSDYAVSAAFSNAITPDHAFSIDNVFQNDRYTVKLSDSEKVFATVTSQKHPKTEHLSTILFKHSEESGVKLKPIANNSKEITFLDCWSGSVYDDNVIAAGNFKYRSECLDFLSEISQAENFGRDFLLIEFMSLTVLSSLTWNKMIDMKDNYGFARLRNYRCGCTLHDGDNLRAVVSGKVVCNGVIWQGIVTDGGRVIASIEQGADLPLKKRV